MMSPSVIVSVPCGSASWIVYPSIERVPATWNVSVGRTTPEDSAAAAVIVLLTEPGSKVSVTARFTQVARVGGAEGVGVETRIGRHRVDLAGARIHHDDRSPFAWFAATACRR